MTKFGTPIGAGPKSATVSPGLVVGGRAARAREAAAGRPGPARSARARTRRPRQRRRARPPRRDSHGRGRRHRRHRRSPRVSVVSSTGSSLGAGAGAGVVGVARGRRRGLRRRGFVVAPRKVDARAAGEVDVRVASAARAAGQVDLPAAGERHPAAPVLVRQVDADSAGEVDVVAAAPEDLGADGRRRADHDRDGDRDEENGPPGHLLSTPSTPRSLDRRPLALAAPPALPAANRRETKAGSGSSDAPVLRDVVEAAGAADLGRVDLGEVLAGREVLRHPPLALASSTG